MTNVVDIEAKVEAINRALMRLEAHVPTVERRVESLEADVKFALHTLTEAMHQGLLERQRLDPPLVPLSDWRSNAKPWQPPTGSVAVDTVLHDHHRTVRMYEKANTELHTKVRELQAKVAELATENLRLKEPQWFKP